mgnify:FL=1
MERQLPKNVRQIGNVSDTPKIYVEDYVDTFFAQLCEKCEKSGKGPMGAFLVGDIQQGDNEEYVYIYGAIQMHDLKMSGSEYVLDEDTWKHAYEDCKQYFEDGEMLGWFVAHPGVPLIPDASTVKLHKKSFPKKNTVFIMKDPVEKEETYYVHKMNDLMEIGGHYTYYEKNPCMQNYMISSRKKNGVFSTETVEDRAAKDFRDLVRKRGESRKGRQTGSLMYAAGAGLVLVLLVMGVSLINSFDRMKSVQDTLNAISGNTDSIEARETSGTVTAVTEEQAGNVVAGEGQASDNGEDSDANNSDVDSGDSADAADPQDIDTPDTQDADKTDGSDSAAGTAQGTGTDGQASAVSGGNGSDGVYIVEEGDTLAIISRKMYGDLSHVDAICKMNGIENGNLIYVGQKLLLP